MCGPVSYLQHLQLLLLRQVAGLGWAGLGWAGLGWAGLEPPCSIRCDSIIVVAAAASRKRIVVRFSEYVQSVVRGCVQAAGISICVNLPLLGAVKT